MNISRMLCCCGNDVFMQRLPRMLKSGWQAWNIHFPVLLNFLRKHRMQQFSNFNNFHTTFYFLLLLFLCVLYIILNSFLEGSFYLNALSIHPTFLLRFFLNYKTGLNLSTQSFKLLQNRFKKKQIFLIILINTN